ncbi:hypothetical protein [Microvirga pakistanensis]|uniref:hypothetical protein n=1 Tax=Microvirga pakistanensis TaxID=1682650 RepID=UPI00106D89F9|nr:hypothetical protein [Microvirga pakistanensis]
MQSMRRPEIDIQSLEAEVIGPMREQKAEAAPPLPSATRMARQWREFQARERWRADRLRAD